MCTLLCVSMCDMYVLGGVCGCERERKESETNTMQEFTRVERCPSFLSEIMHK